MLKILNDFIELESVGAILLFLASILALVMSNSTYYEVYHSCVKTYHIVSFSGIEFNISLQTLMNEGLMTFFFLVVGLEIKYALFYGSLNAFSKAILPAIAALGGILLPALIYTLINFSSPMNMRGWAVPIATDIAISLSVLSLLGDRVPSSLKIFLMALAIFDDLIAIIVIAFFYSSGFEWIYSLYALSTVFFLILLNRIRIKNLILYLVLGFILWFYLLKLGVHPTMAGVILAFAVPTYPSHYQDHCPSQRLKKLLHPFVALLVLPLFAYANAGVSVISIDPDNLDASIIAGNISGLFIGKQLGIFAFCYLAVKLGLAKLPINVQWVHIYGVAIISGIGFTVSLFIGTLAFSYHAIELDSVKIGVLAGSLLSGVFGYLLLRFNNSLKRSRS